MKEPGKKPRSPRQQYEAEALIYAGNRQFTCRLINIAASGVLLYSPEEVVRGTFIRLNLTLPGLDQVLDIDGVVARVGQKDRYIVLGVKFLDPSPEFTSVLGTFVKWLEERRNKKDAPPRNGNVPPSKAAPKLARSTTGPHFPRVTTSDLRQAVKKIRQRQPETREERNLLREEVEARWSQREHESKVRQQLRTLYHEALRDLERKPTNGS